MYSHPLCRRHYGNLTHQRWPKYAIIGTIHDIISTLDDHHPKCLWHQKHCIHDVTCTIYDMSSPVYDITFTICVTSHHDCIYDITQSMFTTYPLNMASHTVLGEQSHCVTLQPLCLIAHPGHFCHHTPSINFIKCSVSMTSQPLYAWHHMHAYDITTCLHDITKHYLWHHFPCIHDITPNISDIASTVSVSSQPLYWWPQINCKCDITHTLCMQLYPLSITSHPLCDFTPL